jgi:hypothetical protein
MTIYACFDDLVMVSRFFFLDLVFLPEGTGISGYREISEIPPIYRTKFFKQILNSNFFAPKQIKFVSILLRNAGLVEW